VRIKQHVWGTRYVDELCQLTIYAASGDENPIDYWACQDSNYNVLGVVDSDAVLVERYEGICEAGHQGLVHDEEGRRAVSMKITYR
jgi:hypothetical protein